MPRRRVPPKRDVLPDPKYGNKTLAKFMNHVMVSGKKAVAERIVYGALDKLQERGAADPIEVFDTALEAVAPSVEVKSRRVGGATYQVPMELSSDRSEALALRWIVTTAKTRKGSPMCNALAKEILDAYEGEGSTIRRRDEVHRMAQANKAFAHFRW